MMGMAKMAMLRMYMSHSQRIISALALEEASSSVDALSTTKRPSGRENTDNEGSCKQTEQDDFS